MAYSLDLRKRAIVLLEGGQNVQEVGAVLGVHSRTISGWKRRHLEGRLSAHYPTSRGAYHINDAALLAHLAAHPDAYLEELAAVAGGTAQGILHAMRRLNITRKKRPRTTVNAMKKREKPMQNR